MRHNSEGDTVRKTISARDIASRGIAALGQVLLAVAALLLGFNHACADTYPSKSITMVVPFTAGGTTDILAREVGQRLALILKQPVTIDNKPGAGGIIGTELVARAPADGYLLLVASVGPIAINPTLHKGRAVNPLTDLIPVGAIAEVPNVLVVHPSVPAKSLEEFVRYVKSKPGQYNYPSTGVGTSAHLFGFRFSNLTGINATHIPYKGAEAVRDLLAGRVQYMFATIPSVIGYFPGGQLKPLAVTSKARSKGLPDVPTMAEGGVEDFIGGSWFGVFAPKGTPPDIVSRLNKAINEILGDEQVRTKMIREGADPMPGTPQDFGRFVLKEYETWKPIVEASGATAN
ncbi:MAG: tripartite tricarboxylate transporter substrate binding protein [Rhodocyclaceae bacterium]|nr:MAG: tripartite tricarboxylate transporter substrate binding protein [Rhodocyclaceae bacterium]